MAKKSVMEQAIELGNWERTVKNMMQIIPNNKYTYTNPKNKYYFFTEHMKGWVEGLFGNTSGKDGYFSHLEPKDMDEEQQEWKRLTTSYLTPMNSDWWQVAMEGGKNPDSPLPTLETTLQPDEVTMMKDEVYDKFLPVYRALKESFEKRWWFEWIFNHRQYTAERDTLKVMTNMMLSMTGDKESELNDRYESYKGLVPTSTLADINRIEQIRAKTSETMKEALAKGKEETERERNIELFEQQQQEQKKEELNQIMQKDASEFSMEDQYKICTQDQTFKTEIIKRLQAAFENKGNNNLIKLMGASNLYAPLSAEADKFCKAYDFAVNSYNSTNNYADEVKAGVEGVFKVALNATKFLKVTDLKDRVIIAQKLTDIMVNAATPVSFKHKEYGAYGKGFVVLQDADAIRSMLSTEATPEAIDAAITGAQETFGQLYPENKVQDIEPIKVEIEQPNVPTSPRVDNTTNVKEFKLDK